MEIMKFENLTANLIADSVEVKARTAYPDARFTRGAIEKNNGIWKNALMVQVGEESGVQATLYVDDVTEQVERGAINVDDAVEELCTTLQFAVHTAPKVSDVKEKINKDNLYVTVVNREANADRLAHSPHLDIPGTDLSLLANIRIDDRGSVRVTNDLCPMLQDTPSAIMEQAIRNTNQFGNWQIKSVIETLLEHIDDEMMRDEMLAMNEAAPPMLVITDINEQNAAGPFISETVREEIARKLGCQEGDGFYLIPSSVYETLAVPADDFMDAEFVKQLVMSVNEEQVPVEQRLSDNVYYCDADSLKITMATGAEAIAETRTQTASITMTI